MDTTSFSLFLLFLSRALIHQDELLWYEVQPFITANRLANVLSKHGALPHDASPEEVDIVVQVGTHRGTRPFTVHMLGGFLVGPCGGCAGGFYARGRERCCL